MKLTYRGTTYALQPAALSMSDALETTTRELRYRGCSYTSHAMVPVLSDALETVTRVLTYRGRSYQYEVPVNPFPLATPTADWGFSRPIQPQEQLFKPKDA